MTFEALGGGFCIGSGVVGLGWGFPFAGACLLTSGILITVLVWLVGR